MSDIELVIKLSEEEYKYIMGMQFCILGIRGGKGLLSGILNAIRTGIPLPKGNEKLIDTNDIKMTRTEAVDELNFFKGTLPKEPPEECDYLDEWYYLHEKLINAINMGIEALLEKQKTIIETEKVESEG